jgi:hypothetical protein
MLSENCPRCGKDANVIGDMLTTGSYQEFLPQGIRWLEHFRRRLFHTTIVRFRGPYRACLDCGLVWSNLDPGELRKVIER